MFSHSVVSNSSRTVAHPMGCSPRGSSVRGDSPGKNTGVGCHTLLQGIFLTEGLNPGFPHCRQILYHLSHQGSLRILEWVAYPFYRGSSRRRNWTGVSRIASRFFTSWATTEVPKALIVSIIDKIGPLHFGIWPAGPYFIVVLECLIKTQLNSFISQMINSES